MDYQTLKLKISRSENLPILPNVVLHLLRLFGKSEVSTRQIEMAIESDAGLVAKVLRVASSPYYGAGGCKDISRAMSVIGMNRMKQIAIGLAYQLFVHEKSQVPSFDKLFFWEHCMLRAVIARDIMAVVSDSKQFDAYTAGLVADVGLLAMDRFMPADLSKAINNAVGTRTTLVVGEERACGFNHKQVGVDLAERWKLPAFLQDAIAFYDNPEQSQVDRTLCNVLAVANTLTFEMGYPTIRGVQCTETTEQYLPAISMSEEQVGEIVAKALEVVAEAKKEMLGRKAA